MDFDQKIAKLSSLGFKQNKLGITDLRYTFTYEQIDELSSIELDEFINDILKIALKEHIKQDEDFAPYLGVIDDAVDSIEDTNLYKLDKRYSDISYVVLYKVIINLDEVYELCKTYKD
jgi:hypothetical protein